MELEGEPVPTRWGLACARATGRGLSDRPDKHKGGPFFNGLKQRIAFGIPSHLHGHALLQWS